MPPASSATRSMSPRAFRTRRRRRGGRVWLVAAMTLLLVAVALASRTPIGQAFDLSHAATRTPTPDPAARLPGWTLVWWDEFNGPSLDGSKWTVVSDAPGGFHHCCLSNTLNAWAADDVSMVGGALRLTTERWAFQGRAYTSGAVTTQGKFDFLYGRLDIRARMPKGNGLWPAFWLLPTTMPAVPSFASYEVDVMEALGQDPHTDYMVNWVGTRHVYCRYTGPDFSADFHVYSFIWTATSMSWLIDGVQRCVRQHNIPTTRMNLTLNTRIGGSWPVPPDASTFLPQYTDIDYVRVYSAAAP